jgi:hypothetical protein
MADQQDQARIEAHHRPLGIGGVGIEIEHVLYAGDIGPIHLGDAPHVPAPGLQVVLRQSPAYRFRAIARHVRSVLTIPPASGSGVQQARPVGGLEQAVATNSASSLPLNLRCAPGRGSSFSAASRLRSTKHRLMRPKHRHRRPLTTCRSSNGSRQTRQNLCDELLVSSTIKFSLEIKGSRPAITGIGEPLCRVPAVPVRGARLFG